MCRSTMIEKASKKRSSTESKEVLINVFIFLIFTSYPFCDADVIHY